MISRLSRSLRAPGSFLPVSLTVYRGFSNTTASASQNAEQIQKEDKAKKHKEMNQKFHEYRQQHQFDLENPARLASRFATDAQRKRQVKELKEMFEGLLLKVNSSGWKAVDEKEFMGFLAKISRTHSNESVLKDPKFKLLIQQAAEKIGRFKDARLVCLFIRFCSLYSLDFEGIWDCFRSWILNNQEKLNVELKLLILLTISPVNKDRFEGLFEIFTKEFTEKVRAERYSLRSVYEILYTLRSADKGSEELFMEIEKFIDKSIADISLDNLLTLIGYYSTSVKEKSETINRFLDRLERKTLQMVPFLIPHEIIQVLYSYLRRNAGSDELLQKIELRAISIMDKFSLSEIEKLIVLTAGSPRKHQVFEEIERHVLQNIKTMKPHNYPTIFFTFALNNIGSEMFYSIITDKIIGSLFMFSPEQISKLVWSYAIKSPQSSLFFKKAQEYIVANTARFSVSEIANIVWSFTEIRGGSPLMFYRLEEEIKAKAKEISAKEVAKVLWGYVNKMALSKPTVEALIETVKAKKEDLDSWDLATILWGVSRLKTSEYDFLYDDLRATTLALIEEMNNYELVTSFRAYSEKARFSDELLMAFLRKMDFVVKSLSSQECVTLLGSLLQVKPSEPCLGTLAKSIETIEKRLKEIESVKK